MQLRPSKKAGLVLACLLERGSSIVHFCDRADSQGNIDVTKFPWASEEPDVASPYVPPSGPDWPVSLILGRGLSTSFEDLRGAPPLRPEQLGERCTATVTASGGETNCSSFNPVGGVDALYRREMHDGHFANALGGRENEGCAAKGTVALSGWWDALILEAALRSDADVLISEEGRHQRRFVKLRVENPFV